MLVFVVTAIHAEEWRGLEVAKEDRCAPYDRGEYAYPGSVEAGVVASLGDVFGPYSCERFASTADTQVEHVVALSEAHDSGLCAADRETKRAFARDLANLTLAAPVVNRAKSARDAAEWLPERNHCWFANRVVEVRRAYGLTIDRDEADALEAVLAGCSAGDRREPYCETRSFVVRILVPVTRALEQREASRPSRQSARTLEG